MAAEFDLQFNAQHHQNELLAAAHARRLTRTAELQRDEPAPAGRRLQTLLRRIAGATVLSATPLVGCIEALARRARISLASAEPAIDAVATAAVVPAPDDRGLTSREREVLGLVAEGFTNRRIAETLFISESTAGVHVSNILGKLGAASRTEAATIASRLGLVD